MGPQIQKGNYDLLIFPHSSVLDSRIFYYYFFKGGTWNKIWSLAYLKAKKWRDTQILFSFVQVKNRFAHLEEEKIPKIFNF